MRRRIVVSLLSSLFFAQAAQAADGSSGCGAGWYILKDNTVLSSTLRATTNNLFFNNTFGMTFGTSNCQKHDLVKNEYQEIYYAESNKEILELELAQGDGQYARAYAQVLGCGSAEATTEFLKTTQQQYGTIFTAPETSSQQMLDNTREVILQSAVLNGLCTG